MSKSTKYIVLTTIFVLFCSLFIFLYWIWREMEDAGYESCIASISSKIEQSNITENLIGENRNWKILSEEEVIFLMSNIRGGDCGRFGDQTVDLWNRRINIALRSREYPIHVIIWSNGQDGISGTDDDLVIPYGEKLPK